MLIILKNKKAALQKQETATAFTSLSTVSVLLPNLEAVPCGVLEACGVRQRHSLHTVLEACAEATNDITRGTKTCSHALARAAAAVTT